MSTRPGAKPWRSWRTTDAITRIGLRYINRIKRAQPDERPEAWLNASEYVPKAVLASRPGFIYRMETRPDEHQHVIVGIGETADRGSDGARDIVFDLDCIVEGEFGVSTEDVQGQLSALHEVAWVVFSASMTERLERTMKGGGQ